MEIIIAIATSLLGVLTGFLGATVALKKTLKPTLILDFSEILMNEVMNNVEYQKRIYIIGGLLGQGIRQGIGLARGRGKFKIEDAIGALLQGFISKYLPQTEETQPQAPAIPEIPKHLRT